MKFVALFLLVLGSMAQGDLPNGPDLSLRIGRGWSDWRQGIIRGDGLGGLGRSGHSRSRGSRLVIFPTTIPDVRRPKKSSRSSSSSSYKKGKNYGGYNQRYGGYNQSYGGYKKVDCTNKAYKSSPQCRRAVFANAGKPISIRWKVNNEALTAMSGSVGYNIYLRPYDSTNRAQQWTFLPVQGYSDRYIIQNALGLAMTVNAFPSQVALQPLGTASNQIFRVVGNDDGSFFIHAIESELYFDVRIAPTKSKPVLMIRNYEGDLSQRWLLN